MKIDNQDIIRTAKQLRDEENSQYHIRPWNRSRRFRIPSWAVAVPAAAVVGFLFGIWTNTAKQEGNPLTAIVDTVYIRVNEASVAESVTRDTTATMLASTKPQPYIQNTRKTLNSQKKDSDLIIGRPVGEDEIRYDLLVMN